jgi:hypothetical protein
MLDSATALDHRLARGCGLRSLQEPWIDTATPIGEAMFHITIASDVHVRGGQPGRHEMRRPRPAPAGSSGWPTLVEMAARRRI